MPAPLILIPLAKALMWGLGFVGVTAGAAKFTKHSEENYFNKGQCGKCPGHFKYIEGSAQKGQKAYRCDQCDNTVWIAFGSDEGYKYEPSKNARKSS